MPSMNLKSSARKLPSTLDALKQLDGFIRNSVVGVEYVNEGLGSVVDGVIERAMRRNPSKHVGPRHDQLAFHLGQALECMKANDPSIVPYIEQMEKAFPRVTHQ